jgi:hypothetical protein
MPLLQDAVNLLPADLDLSEGFAYVLRPKTANPGPRTCSQSRWLQS